MIHCFLNRPCQLESMNAEIKQITFNCQNSIDFTRDFLCQEFTSFGS